MNALEFYRLRNDLTQEELGKRIGVSKQTIYKWEKQIAPVSSKHYQMLKDILNLSESEMVNVISSGEISRDASVAENIDPDSLARRYRVLQQRLKQVDFKEDKKVIEEELAKLDRISRRVTDAINDPGEPPPSFPATPDTIRNTPELRECIKDAMLREGIRNASELNRRIGYDSVNSIERLLAGKLNWFPDVLSAVLDGLNIKHDDAPMSAAERGLLTPDGFFNDGAVLVRPMPVVAWANAASYLTSLMDSDGCTSFKWDPETTETIPVPVGIRKNTLVFRVSGVSMEPTINDNDIILAEQRFSFDEISDKKVVVVKFIDGGKYPDSIVCKRLRKFEKQLTLTSDNPNGRDFEIAPRDVEWLGVVVQLLSNRGL